MRWEYLLFKNSTFEKSRIKYRFKMILFAQNFSIIEIILNLNECV